MLASWTSPAAADICRMRSLFHPPSELLSWPFLLLQVARLLCERRTHPLTVPFADRKDNEVGIVAHRKMIALAHHHLACIAEQLLPARLKSERVIAFTENGEQRQAPERAGQGFVQLTINHPRLPGIAHIAVEGPGSRSPYAREKSLATALIHAPADTE